MLLMKTLLSGGARLAPPEGFEPPPPLNRDGPDLLGPLESSRRFLRSGDRSRADSEAIMLYSFSYSKLLIQNRFEICLQLDIFRLSGFQLDSGVKGCLGLLVLSGDETSRPVLFIFQVA